MTLPLLDSWTDGAPSKVITPDPLKLLTGWVHEEQPPYQWMNWIHWTTREKVNDVIGELIENGGIHEIISTLTLVQNPAALGTSVLQVLGAEALATEGGAQDSFVSIGGAAADDSATGGQGGYFGGGNTLGDYSIGGRGLGVFGGESEGEDGYGGAGVHAVGGDGTGLGGEGGAGVTGLGGSGDSVDGYAGDGGYFEAGQLHGDNPGRGLYAKGSPAKEAPGTESGDGASLNGGDGATLFSGGEGGVGVRARGGDMPNGGLGGEGAYLIGGSDNGDPGDEDTGGKGARAFGGYSANGDGGVGVYSTGGQALNGIGGDAGYFRGGSGSTPGKGVQIDAIEDGDGLVVSGEVGCDALISCFGGSTVPLVQLYPLDECAHIYFFPIANAPTAPFEGLVYYDGTLSKLRVYNGSVWQNLH